MDRAIDGESTGLLAMDATDTEETSFATGTRIGWKVGWSILPFTLVLGVMAFLHQRNADEANTKLFPMETKKTTSPDAIVQLASSSACNDKAVSNGRKWHDADGPDYNCDFYAKGTNCQVHGNDYRKFGLTANQACCTCGGGDSPRKDSKYNYRPLRYSPNLQSRFKIQRCQNLKDANGKKLNSKVRRGLARANKKKCIEVYGLLIAGTRKASSNFMRYFANIAAHLLDADCDGKPDDKSVLKIVNKFENEDAPWLNFGHDEKSETEYRNIPGYGYSAQVWKAGSNKRWAPVICLEEMFHLVHQEAWAEVYPKIIGAKEWVQEFPNEKQSLACLCMREAQCKWYQHPENKGCTSLDGKFCSNVNIPGDKMVDGTFPGTCHSAKINHHGCNSPSCDCNEFFHKVHTSWIGNRFTGYERMGPKIAAMKAEGLNQREAVEKLLSQSAKCSDLLVHMKSDALKIPKKHIEETYTCGSSVAPPQPTSPPPPPVNAVEAACENHGFNMLECTNVGCCMWDDGQCWAQASDRCDAHA